MRLSKASPLLHSFITHRPAIAQAFFIAARTALAAVHCRKPKQLARVINDQTIMKITLNRKRAWTSTEDEILKELYGQERSNAIAQKLGRTAQAVRMRAFDLGLTMPGRGGRYPIGYERITRGRPERKIADTGIRSKDWRRIDVLEWEAINGPVPADRILMKKPRMQRTAENLELVSPADIPLLAVAHHATDELRQLLNMKATLGLVIAKIERQHLTPEQAALRRPTDWTDSQKQYLVENQSRPLIELAAAIGRTRKAVSRMSQRMKISGTRRPAPNSWTETDKQRLVSLYPKTGNAELARIFGRTVPSVEHMAARLGKHKDQTCKK